MHRFAGRFSAFFRTDAGCALLVCLLVLAAHLPAVVYRLSANPIFWISGLTSSYVPGRTIGYPWIDPNTGFQTQALGAFSAHQWLHGHIPWWDSYVGIGTPLAGQMQPASLFLPFVLLLHFFSGVLLLKIALQMIAGLATFALLRQLRLGRLAAFSGAAIYALNSTFAWFAHAPIVPTPFLPLLLLGIERAFANAKEKRGGGWIWIAIAIGYSIYAGFPETAYLDGLVAVAWSIYRFVVSPGDRWAFARKVALGGIVGVMIAAPIIVPFLEYQRLSAVQHNGWNHIGLPKISLAAFLMPYLFGPIHAFEAADPSGQVSLNWNAGGGYFNLSLLLLSVTALSGGRRLRGLRILLFIWIAVFVARTLHVTLAEDLLGLIPALDYVAVFRYSQPTWAMCGAILAALALDDWRHGIKYRPVIVAAAVSLAITAVALAISSDVIAQLFLRAPHYSRWFWGSLAWAIVVACSIAALLFRRPGRISARLLTALVVVDAAALFAVPELAGMRKPQLDLGVVTFLRHHLGFERMYTFGPIQPNYGAYVGVASIDYNTIPIPENWVHYVRGSLDPVIETDVFNGQVPGPLSAHEDALRKHIASFELTGVKYVVTPAGENPFTEHTPVSTPEGANLAVPLNAGEQVSGTISTVGVHRISGISVVIGTYGGASTGDLMAKVCAGAVCGSGAASLPDAPDNQALNIALRPAVSAANGIPIRYTFTHTADPAHAQTRAVAIWIWPVRNGSSPIQLPGNKLMPYSPQIALESPLVANPPQPVYRSRVADVYELPNPAPYFQTQGGPCVISPESRESARTSCEAPAILVRRELFYSGWRAYVNGRREQIQADSIFQSIHLPAGESRILFAYSPTHIVWACAAMIAGFLAICLQLVTSQTARRRRNKPADALLATQ